MGCPASGCSGYELMTNLDFDTNSSGNANAGDDYWNGGSGWAPIGNGAGGDDSAASPYSGTFGGTATP